MQGNALRVGAQLAVIEAMRENHVLTSLCGPYGNVLKIRPPLVFSSGDADLFLTTLDKVLTDLRC